MERNYQQDIKNVSVISKPLDHILLILNIYILIVTTRMNILICRVSLKLLDQFFYIQANFNV